jgi:serine protease Do
LAACTILFLAWFQKIREGTVKAIATVLAALMVASTLGAANTVAELSKEERRVLELTPAVVLIIVTYKIQLPIPKENAEPQIMELNYTATGSGFIYRPDGYIITNGHVVADANLKDRQAQESRLQSIFEGLVQKLEGQMGGKLSPTARQYVASHMSASTPQILVILNNKREYNAEIKQYSDPTGVNNGKDVAIIKIDANNLPTVRLGNSENLHVQEPITVIGYPGVASPLGFSLLSKDSLVVPTITNGHISAVKTDYKGSPVIQSDAAITHGNSGGPAFDPNNEAIGIATFGNMKEVAGFNFFVPINIALEFVRQSGAPPQSGQFDKIWAEALDAYSNHKWETARGLFTDVLGLMPNEPDALRLQNSAAQMAREEGPLQRLMETNGWMVYGAGGLVVLILLALVLVKAMSSKKPALAGSPFGPPPGMPMPPPQPGIGMAPPPPSGTVVMPPPGIAAPAGMANGNFGTLHMTAGALNGNRFPIPKAGLLIGRDSEKCAIVIGDDSVSKEHAWVVPLDNEIVVIDRNSANGTYVNSPDSPRINKVALRNGDRVFLGRKGTTVFTYFAS